VAAAPIFAQIVGSVFNIWYNLTQVRPLLTPEQLDIFFRAVTACNLVAYPAAVGSWLWVVMSLRKVRWRLLSGEPVGAAALERARRRVINLPNWVVALTAPAWLVCIPAILLPLAFTPEPLDSRVVAHLPISVAIGGMIGVGHAFFAVELAGRQLLYPVFFVGARPVQTRGAYPVSLAGRAVICAVAAGVCPIVSLLLLMITPTADKHGPWFAISVGAVGIAFGLSTAYMLARDVAAPVQELRRTAKEVAGGNLEVQAGLQRADEFGELIDEFNDMVSGLREKQHIMESFGRHVGRRAARQILDRNPGLGGENREITVLFADLRNFTERSSRCSPEKVVDLLNRFLSEMVAVVEHHGGMVNKFLGDGFMAIFGAWEPEADHAQRAVRAGSEMLARLQTLNVELEAQCDTPLKMGVGIHTGPAVVGSIGSPQRMEYTAVGDTVNVASRLESLTKTVGEPMVFSAPTRRALPEHFDVKELPVQRVKGKSQPLEIYGLRLAAPEGPATGNGSDPRSGAGSWPSALQNGPAG
jgi:adenylate cyclase